MYTGYYESPIGLIEIKGDEYAIHRVNFVEKKEEDAVSSAIVEKCIEELNEYFQGGRKQFTVALHMSGTPFQERVWQKLCNIPYGTTASYKDIAVKVGNEKASRAVGGANNKNPIAIIVPCHRVVGTNNKLVGYAGGLTKKEWLLKHEESKS